MSNRGSVFNVYIKHLLDNNKSNGANDFNNTKFDAWFLYDYKQDNPAMSSINLTFNEVTANATCCEYLGPINNAIIETISTVDGLESEFSYESSAFFDTPVSSYLFSNYDKPQTGTMIDRDIYYSAYDYSVYSAKAYNYDLLEYPDLIPQEHGHSGPHSQSDITPYNNYIDFIKHFSAYNFESGYSPNEYRIYGIKEEPLCEDQTNLKADNSSFTGKIDGFIGNGILVTWYNGNRASKDEADNKLNDYIFNEPKNPENSIPCAYYKLPKKYTPLKRKVKVEWSDDGLISVK